MLYVHKTLRNYLFSLRIVIFVIFFIFYFVNMNGGTRPLLFLLLLSLILTLLLSIQKTITYWKLLTTTDLFINILIVNLSGGWHSPFILYAYTSLIWLGIINGIGRSLLLKGVLFWAIISGFYVWQTGFSLHIQGSTMLINMSHLLFIVILYLVSRYFAFVFKSTYRKWLIIRAFGKRFTYKDLPEEVIIEAERCVERLFNVKNVYICWAEPFTSSDQHINWRRNHYQFALQQGDHFKKKICTMTLIDYIGREMHLFYFPIYDQKKVHGAFLIPLTEGRELVRFSYIYLFMLSYLILNHMVQLQNNQKLAIEMNRQVKEVIAQDLHDGLAQKLFFMSAQIHRMKGLINQMEVPQLLEGFAKIEEYTELCHQEVRSYFESLLLEVESEQLPLKIEQLIKHLTKNHDLETNLNFDGYVEREELLIEETILRIIEEAISNVIKHAGAKQVYIHIEVTSYQWTITIEDDGIGISKHVSIRQRGHYGLSGMKERVQRVGGLISIQNRAEGGTKLVTIIPRGGVNTYGYV